jgi:hypothetical protein
MLCLCFVYAFFVDINWTQIGQNAIFIVSYLISTFYKPSINLLSILGQLPYLKPILFLGIQKPKRYGVMLLAFALFAS